MAKVLLKKSSVPSNVPTTGNLDYGELAINYADGRLYYKNSSNVIKKFVDSAGTVAVSRKSISITDAGGDGSLSYNNSTGVITYTGPSATEVRAHFTGGKGIAITTGNISIDSAELYSQYKHDNFNDFVANEHIDHSSVSILAGWGLNGGGNITASRTLSVDSDQIKSLFSAGTGVTYSSGVISIGQAVGTGNTPTFNGLSAGSAKITSLATPTVATDAANKSYVDTVVSAALHYHDPVRVEGTINLNATYNNGDSGDGATLTNAGTQAALVLDGISVDSDDRVLIYEQTNQTQNGVYVVTHPGTASSNWVLTRSADTNTYSPSSSTNLGKGDAFYVREGATGAGELYVMNTAGTIIFGTTNITFSQISSAQIYKAGYGIELNGVTFRIDSDRAVLSVNSLKGNITATNLLDAIKTVDGTTSGLDADLLDGNHASAFYLATNPSGYTTNTGTVTSVDMTVPTGFAISGRPITSSGTLALTYSAGYQGFTSAESSKLAGIEAGATADMTASEILTALKTVDTDSSGLNADTLDGQQGSYYRINVYNASGVLLN
jgi:hypothetical protein